MTAPSPAPQTGASVAQPDLARQLYAALTSSAVDAALRFHRGTSPWLVRTHCESCPPERRWRSDVLATPDLVRAFAATLLAPDAPRPADGTSHPLRHGDPRCDGTCCTYATGLVDHATLYLSHVCFGWDREGPFVLQLTLIDGT